LFIQRLFPAFRLPFLALRGLSQPQVFEGRVRVSTANVGNDHQLQYFHACEVNLIVLNFACRLRGTEVPLLPHDFAKTWISF
jgi:hypothetical protein